MVKHLKNYWIIYLFFALTLVSYAIVPKAEVVLTGTNAWMYIWLMVFSTIWLLFSSIFGGELIIKFNGIIPQIKQWNKTLIVNGVEKQLKGNYISYGKVLELVGKKYGVYTVTFSRGKNEEHGSMIQGDVIKLTNRMIFNVTDTNNA